jgi:CDP-diacylglycerol--glycerol-3-phosphate 3-phosphatidyltransferase
VAVRSVSPPLAHLPNALTVARLAVIPVYAALILTADGGRSWPAAILFGAAAITDQIDGFLARRWHVESAFGKIADPLADRVLIDIAVILLWHAGRLPWLALAIPVRDLVLVAATPFAIARGYRFEVNLLGKAATWLLYSGIAFTMVTSHGTGWPRWIFWAGLGVAFASLVLYGRKARAEVQT